MSQRVRVRTAVCEAPNPTMTRPRIDYNTRVWNHAEVAELADALDSNSSEAHTSCGFDPRLRHHSTSRQGNAGIGPFLCSEKESSMVSRIPNLTYCSTMCSRDMRLQ